ncbi:MULTISPECIES: hypothetical protein [Flavobacterium]|uniref:Uncharacterized protein n=1 Tax=Flavobacterium keumense TaxID=1306518 RepID=A0ABY8N2L3_9FLAO|nr:MULTISPECIES: hypothetical protein [Flavobacterium]WGK93772.1 hypothetical protein MG292_06625 [Flavobacterium keumense]
MNFTEAQQAINDAKNTLNKADEMVRQLGSLMIGRLKQMRPYDLAKLKKELDAFNAKTKEWK